MDKKRILLLSELRKNARQSLTSLGRELSMPISTLHDRIREQEEGLVKKYTCVLDFSKLGFACRTQVILKVKNADKDQVREHLLKSPNVNTVYRINNGYDFLVECVFKEMQDAERFMERLEERFKLVEKHVYYIMEDIAREVFLTDPVHVDLVEV